MSFIFANILVITNLFAGPSMTDCGLLMSYDKIEVRSQSLIASGAKQDATRGPGIYIPHFIWPVDHSRTGEGFGVWRPDTNSMHMGMDIFPGEGTPIVAAQDGIVTKVEEGSGSYGYAVMIYDGYQYTTVYAHMIAGSFAQYGIAVGTQVKQGQVIGLVGNTGRSTGPHLHFEIRDEGSAIDPEPVMARYATN